jgi:hypothetical protein
MSFWRARLFTSIVAIGMGLAWVTATQHCLLSAVKADTLGPACHCSDHCQGSGGQDNGRMLSCCQGLLSQALELAQSKIKFTPVVFRSQLTALDRLIDYEPPPAIGVDSEYDTGPPQRKLLSRNGLEAFSASKRSSCVRLKIVLVLVLEGLSTPRRCFNTQRIIRSRPCHFSVYKCVLPGRTRLTAEYLTP